ncbi:MAG: TMEM175 family protein [bacterium]|nr:TMEM175 family protein [bacterium]
MGKNDEKELVEEVETVISRDRVLNFSDAIFAFAATLLVLKIDLPNIPPALIETHLGPEILRLWPQYVANLITFFVIGYYWLTHHAIFNMIKRFNQTLFWLNIIFLVFISFLPFPVDLFGDFSNSRAVVVFYSAALGFAGYLLAILWLYVSHGNRLVAKSLSKRRIEFYTVKIMIAPVIFTLSIPVAFIDLTLTKLSWLFVLLGIVLVHRIYHYRQLDEVEKTAL